MYATRDAKYFMRFPMEKGGCIFLQSYKYADTIQECASWLADVISRTFEYYIICVFPEHYILLHSSSTRKWLFFSVFAVNVTCCFCTSLSIFLFYFWQLRIIALNVFIVILDKLKYHIDIIYFSNDIREDIESEKRILSKKFYSSHIFSRIST